MDRLKACFEKGKLVAITIDSSEDFFKMLGNGEFRKDEKEKWKEGCQEEVMLLENEWKKQKRKEFEGDKNERRR